MWKMLYVCDNAAENYRLDITYENNLIIKLVLVSIHIFGYCSHRQLYIV